MTDLGRLERVDLRTVWEKEDQHFTPWLAKEANIQILAETLGLELEVEAQEKDVGPFRADILCKDVDTDSWVLIENQLERTDHTHLGQLLTYAAGLSCVTIVWIAQRFTEEHRATLDWLNEITDDSFKFFGLEVELWRIGNSPPAPKFNVTSKPNDWTRSVGRAARSISNEISSETKALQLRYWTEFRAFLDERKSPIRGNRTPRPQHWATFSVGRSGFHLAATVHTRENRIGAELFIRLDGAKAYFHRLMEDREAIDREFGTALDWQELPDRKGSRIALYKDNEDPSNIACWPSQHSWLAEQLESFRRVFEIRLKALDLSERLSEEPVDA